MIELGKKQCLNVSEESGFWRISWNKGRTYFTS